MTEILTRLKDGRHETDYSFLGYEPPRITLGFGIASDLVRTAPDHFRGGADRDTCLNRMAGGFLTSENAIREIERRPFDASVTARSIRKAGLGMQSAFTTKLNFRKAFLCLLR